MGENEVLLREHGLVEGPELPPEYAEFIESLSEDEVRVLVDLKLRLDEAGLPTTKLMLSVPIL